MFSHIQSSLCNNFFYLFIFLWSDLPCLETPSECSLASVKWKHQQLEEIFYLNWSKKTKIQLLYLSSFNPTFLFVIYCKHKIQNIICTTFYCMEKVLSQFKHYFVKKLWLQLQFLRSFSIEVQIFLKCIRFFQSSWWTEVKRGLTKPPWVIF